MLKLAMGALRCKPGKEKTMTRGEELWQAAEMGTKTGDLKSQHVLQMYALAQMLATAETALLKDDLQAAAVGVVGILAAMVLALTTTAAFADGDHHGDQLLPCERTGPQQRVADQESHPLHLLGRDAEISLPGRPRPGPAGRHQRQE